MTVTKKQLESNLWKFYITKIDGLAIAAPIFAIFLLSRGLTITQVFTLEAIYGLMVLILEIPTGAISDLIGRKKTLIISSFAVSFGMFVYSQSFTFVGFLIGEFLVAIGHTLLSGTDTSFLYDTLKKLKRSSEYKKIFGNANSFSFVISSVLVIIGGFLASISIDLPLKVAAVVIAFFTFLMFSLVEPPYKRQGLSASKYVSQMKDNVIFTFTHKRVRWLTIFTGVTSAMMILAFWYYQPYMKAVNLDIAYFGIVFSVMNIVAAIFSKLAVKIENKLGEYMSLVMIALLPLVSFFIMGKMFAIVAIGAIYLQQAVRGMQSPIITDYINQHLSHSNRATVLSMSGVVTRAVNLAVLPLFGYLVDVWSLGQSMLYAGATFGFVFIIMFLVKPKD
jgi:MFS family permease